VNIPSFELFTLGPTPGPPLAMKVIVGKSADHDTPVRSLFEASARDLSHGCVRVADARKLAVYLLRGDSTWTAERLESALTSDTTFTVPLERPVPVYVMYFTVRADQAGKLTFYPDVYGLDQVLSEALATHW
jgi:L,D-transpeptidase YcbB